MGLLFIYLFEEYSGWSRISLTYINCDKIISQWILGASATLFISVLISFFKGELNLVLWQVILIAVSALGTGTYGIYRIIQLRSLHRRFVAALKLFCEFNRMRAFLILYREKTSKSGL